MKQIRTVFKMDVRVAVLKNFPMAGLKNTLCDQGNGIRNQRMLYCKLSSHVYKQETEDSKSGIPTNKRQPSLVGSPIIAYSIEEETSQ